MHVKDFLREEFSINYYMRMRLRDAPRPRYSIIIIINLYNLYVMYIYYSIRRRRFKMCVQLYDVVHSISVCMFENHGNAKTSETMRQTKIFPRHEWESHIYINVN